MFIKFMLLGNEKQLLHPAMSSLQTCAALKEPPQLLTVDVAHQRLTQLSLSALK